MKLLDKSSPVPLYYQLYTNLLADIRSGVLKPGDMIAPEKQLMEKYKVSRDTVRHALNDLAREGYLFRAKSKGTVVSDISPTVGYRNRVKGFSAISYDNGHVALTSKVLAVCVIEPPPFVKEALKLEDGAKAFYLKRVRSVEGKPNVYVEDWLDYRFIPGIETIDFSKNSLYDTLEQKYNISPCRAERTFECCFASDEEQITELQITKNKPLLRCTSYVYDRNDRLLEFYIAIVNGKYTVNE
ncbi:MAG: GntR family transcriptional regulator [Oscillospiraceae bacterium]|nr:GntR family transcriptional regulator [Oscillospiraceae bacterium]